MVRNPRTQLFPNVFAAGLTYVVAIGIGFIMPRIIYESVGQEALGVWDLGWSFLVYVSFSGIGFGQAVAHFIAGKDAQGQSEDIASICSTGWWGQCLAATFTAGLFVLVMQFAGQSENTDLVLRNELEQITTFLSLTICVVMFGDIAHGVLIGQHESRITEYINLVHDVMLAIAMIAALLLGLGIQGLALVTFLLRVCSELTRYAFAFRVCRHMNLDPRIASFSNMAILLRYSLKTSITVLQDLLVFQSMRLVLFLSLGPLALAAFSRYATIIRQINRMPERLSLSLASMTSALVAGGAENEVPRLYIQSTRLAVLISLPLLVIFAVCGDLIVTVWMGPEFVIDHVAVLLASGALLHANYAISYRLLSGLNAHGRIGLFSIFLSGVAILSALLTVTTFTAVTAALVVAIVLLVTVHLPHISFMLLKTGASPIRMLIDIYKKPLLLNGLFLMLMLVCRKLAESGGVYTAAVLATLAGVLVIWSSWRYVLDAQIKLKIKEFFVRPQTDSEPGVN